MARKSSRKTLKNEKKPVSQFQRVTTMGPEVGLCTYVHFLYKFFNIFFYQKWYRGFLILGFISFGIGYLMLGPAPFLTFLPQRFVTT